MHTGKQLEQLVRTIQEFLLPLGFDISSNVREFGSENTMIAEFDIVITGQTEDRTFKWLIECRDRPRGGPVPGQWIEQLVGRKKRFKFDKVTAVSTSGFAEGVKAFATEEGIELRAVDSLSAQDIVSWFRSDTTRLTHLDGYLNGAKIIPSTPESSEWLKGMQIRLGEPVLRSIESGQNISAIDMFGAVVEHKIETLELTPRDEPQSIDLCVKFDPPSYTISTENGDVDIAAIIFDGLLTFRTESVPIREILQYQLDSGEPIISQSAYFTLPLVDGPIDLEFHRLLDTGETKVLFRKNST